MAKYSMDEVGSSCHIHSSLWDADGTTSLMWDDDVPRPPLPRLPRLARRPGRHRPRARVDVRPDRELVQALPAGVVGADRARVGARQPHLRVPPRRPRPGVPRSSHGSPAPTPTSTSRSRQRSRPGCTGSSRASNRRRSSTATRTRRPASPTSRGRSSTRSTSSSAATVADAAFGPAVHAHLVNTAKQEWAAFNRAVTDWERRRNFVQF